MNALSGVFNEYCALLDNIEGGMLGKQEAKDEAINLKNKIGRVTNEATVDSFKGLVGVMTETLDSYI